MLIRKLADFPAEVRDAALAYEPYRLDPFRAGDGREVPWLLPGLLGPRPGSGVTAARLVLVDATRIVLRNVLEHPVLAPERLERKPDGVDGGGGMTVRFVC